MSIWDTVRILWVFGILQGYCGYLGYCKDIMGIWDTVSNVVSTAGRIIQHFVPARVRDSYVLHSFHTSPGPTQPSIQWVLYICFIQHEANQSPPSTAEVGNELS